MKILFPRLHIYQLITTFLFCCFPKSIKMLQTVKISAAAHILCSHIYVKRLSSMQAIIMAMSPIRIMINSWKSWSDCNHILWTVKDLSSVFRNEHVLYVCIILDRLDLAIMLHNESAAASQSFCSMGWFQLLVFCEKSIIS